MARRWIDKLNVRNELGHPRQEIGRQLYYPDDFSISPWL
jgi:hypothetical protein